MSVAIGVNNPKSVLRKPEAPAKDTKTTEAKKVTTTTAAKTTKK